MSLPSSIKIASAQYGFDRLATLDEWEAKISRWVEQGAVTGAELLVFPEYAAIELAGCFGGEVSGDLQKTLECVAELTEQRVQLHVTLAEKHNVHILVGSGPVKNDEGHFVNVAQLVAPNGSVGVQEKMIMTPFEKEWGVEGGAQLRVFDTSLGRIGVLICYDCEFPLLARAMVDAGAEVLLVPSCTEKETGFNRVKIGAQARALENGVVTVQSATVGDAPWSPAIDYNYGAAGIYVPPEESISADGVLFEGSSNEVGWVNGVVDITALRKLRDHGEMRNYHDWSVQPGAGELGGDVDFITLK